MKKLKNQEALILKLLKKTLPHVKTLSLLSRSSTETAFVWEEKKISFIFLSERPSLKRLSKAALHKDLKTVWLLDDSVFNQKRIYQEELKLPLGPRYFFHISSNKEMMMVYDQKESIEKTRRRPLSNPLAVDLSQPYFEKGLLYFKGDLIYRTQNSLNFRIVMQKNQPKTKKIFTSSFNKKTVKNLFLLVYKAFVKKINGRESNSQSYNKPSKEPKIHEDS